MKIWIWMLVWGILGAGCVAVKVADPEAPPRAAAGPAELRLDVTCLLPADGPPVTNGRLLARLYEYDPRIADRQAREVARAERTGVVHPAGQESVLRFQCAGKTPERRAYYLTVAVYPEAGAKDRPAVYFLDGFQRVLAAGNVESLRVVLQPPAEWGEATN